MELYFKNSEGQLQETTLKQMLIDAFGKAGLKMDNGSFASENHEWIGVIQETKQSQVATNITFKEDGNTIKEVNVYETPIKKVIDSDNCRKLI